MALNPKFAAHLKKLTRAKRLNPAALGRAVGVTHTAARHYLNGRVPQADVLQRLGEFFAVNLCEYLPSRRSPESRDLYKLATIRHKIDSGHHHLNELIRAGQFVVVDVRTPGSKIAALRITAKSYAAYLQRIEKAASAKPAKMPHDDLAGTEPARASENQNAKGLRRFAKASGEQSEPSKT